jgi:ArsR family transcriptional regulator
MSATATTRPDPKVLARSFQALADEKRLRVLELLGSGELCVCDLAEALGVSQPLLSFHLRTLRDAGLVSARKKGRWVHYSLNRGTLVGLGGVAEALGDGVYESDEEAGKWARIRRCQPSKGS